MVGPGTTLSPIARRAWLGVLAAGAVLGGSFMLSLAPVDSNLEQNDFGQEYLLARAILDRADPYQPIRDLGARYVGVGGYFDKPYPTPHPPTVGLLVLPFGLLSYTSAVRAWFVVELVCLIAAVTLLVRGAHLPLPLRNVPILAVALVAWPPVILELGLGQLTLPLLLGLAGAQVALVGGRSRLGGGLLGLTLLIKPLAWPWLIVLAYRRDWRAVAGAALVAISGGVLSLVAIGVGPTANYLFHVLPTASGAFLAEPTNMSLWTVGPRLNSVFPSPVLPALALVLVGWWCGQRRRLAVHLAMMTIAGLLISPITWAFYFVLALLPVACVVGAVWRRGFRPIEVSVTLVVLALMSLPQSQLMEAARVGAGAGILLEPTLAVILLGILLGVLTQPVRE